MDIKDIIRKKRDGGILSKDEIEFFIKGYTDGIIPDYQISALLMAIYFNGLNEEETLCLTMVMRDSGDIIDLSSISGIKVDKHSTGGVGDKTTLIVGPIVASCGVPIAKMSGRGLGFTGGTVDKLESIPGFKTTLAPEEFIEQVNKIGIAVIGQSGSITPADKKLYALRDVTETVESMSLIASSIMSKKLAAGSDSILLDVKCGNGAFMKSIEDAEELAQSMMKIGNGAGKKVIAMVTDMNQPLGRAVGNSLEVKEAIEVLKGDGPTDITELSLELAGAMIFLGGRVKALEEGVHVARQALYSGAGLNKLKDLITAQGGDPNICDNAALLGEAKYKLEIKSKVRGYVSDILTDKIGIASQKTGAGREIKGDDIDYLAGIYFGKKVGEYVSAGDVLAVIHSNDKKKSKDAAKILENAYILENIKPKTKPLINKIMRFDKNLFKFLLK